MSAKNRHLSIAAICTVLGLLGGATSTWAATVGKLNAHIGTAQARVAIMCAVAEYQVGAMEHMCLANGAPCPRPSTLQPQVLARACNEPAQEK